MAGSLLSLALLLTPVISVVVGFFLITTPDKNDFWKSFFFVFLLVAVPIVGTGVPTEVACNADADGVAGKGRDAVGERRLEVEATGEADNCGGGGSARRAATDLMDAAI